ARARRARVQAVRARARAPAQRRADVVVRGPRGFGHGGGVPGRPDRAPAPGEPARGGRRDRLPDRCRGGRDGLVLRVRARGARAVRHRRGRVLRARAARVPDADAAAPAGGVLRGGVSHGTDPVSALLGGGGALIPALAPIDFRDGFLILAALYLVAIIGYLTPDILARRRG